MPLFRYFTATAALTALAAAPAIAQHSYGHRGGGASAIVYAHADFRGQSLRVTGPVPRLSQYNFNDRISSIRVTGGSWEVCVHADFRGRCEILTYRADGMNEYRLNDKISSIRPANYRGGYDRHDRGDRWGRDRYGDRDYGRGGYRGDAPVVLYQHANYRGNALPVTGAIPYLHRLGFNNKASSIAVNQGRWEVCSEPNFRGHCEIVTGSIDKAGYYRMNDRISSIRPAGRHSGRRW